MVRGMESAPCQERTILPTAFSSDAQGFSLPTICSHSSVGECMIMSDSKPGFGVITSAPHLVKQLLSHANLQPLLIGVLFSAFSFGFITLQAFLYFRTFSKDLIVFKITVSTLFFSQVSAMHLCSQIAVLWYFLSSRYSEIIIFSAFPGFSTSQIYVLSATHRIIIWSATSCTQRIIFWYGMYSHRRILTMLATLLTRSLFLPLAVTGVITFIVQRSVLKIRISTMSQTIFLQLLCWKTMVP